MFSLLVGREDKGTLSVSRHTQFGGCGSWCAVGLLGTPAQDRGQLPRAGVNSRRCPCFLIAEPSLGSLPENPVPKWMPGHLVTAAETPRKEGDSTGAPSDRLILLEISGKGAGEQSEGNVKKVRQETVLQAYCPCQGLYYGSLNYLQNSLNN